MSKLEELLVSPTRDFVVDNKGNEVKVAALKGKIVALYFSAHWCPYLDYNQTNKNKLQFMNMKLILIKSRPCRAFTPQLAEEYNKLKDKPFVIVFISSDRDEQSFHEYHGSMPWLAVPFSDRDAKVFSLSFSLALFDVHVVYLLS